jgi:hypothetical protein
MSSGETILAWGTTVGRDWLVVVAVGRDGELLDARTLQERRHAGAADDEWEQLDAGNP